MRATILPAVVLAASLGASGAAPAASAGRGAILYENRCGGCHAESIHSREKRVATDLAAVREWVRRWSANLGLAWTDEEVNDVVAHLNARYYRFACPNEDCRTLGRAGSGQRRLALDGRPR